MALRRLPHRYALFVAAYLESLNGSDAALKAGYSPKGAHIAGVRLLRNETVQKLVATAQRKRLERMNVSGEHVLEGLRRIAFSDVRELFDDKGEPLKPHQLPAEIATCVQAVTIDKSGRVYYRLAEKNKAHDLLARHLHLIDPPRMESTSVNITQIHTVEISLAKLSLDELKEMRALMAKAGIESTPVEPAALPAGTPA